MLVANHQSLADIVVILAAFNDLPIRFVAKAELRKSFPAVSPVLRFQRHALIDRRGNFRAALAELRRLGRRSRGGLCPVVFPEGTRSRTGEIGTFHTGALKAIHTVTPMPLACVALEGGSRIVSFADIRGGMSGTVYRVRVLATRDVSSAQIQSTLQEFHDLIARQLSAWR
jgi:1-acyl-sn-glycerol-3-phosphate acyltransferase